MNNIGYSQFFTIINHNAVTNPFTCLLLYTPVSISGAESANYSPWATPNLPGGKIFWKQLCSITSILSMAASGQQGSRAELFRQRPLEDMCTFHLPRFWMDSPIYTPPAVYLESSIAYSKNSQSTFLGSLYFSHCLHTTPGNFTRFQSFSKCLYAGGAHLQTDNPTLPPAFWGAHLRFSLLAGHLHLGISLNLRTQHPFLLSPSRRVSWDSESSNTLKLVNKQLNENLFLVGWCKSI